MDQALCISPLHPTWFEGYRVQTPIYMYFYIHINYVSTNIYKSINHSYNKEFILENILHNLYMYVYISSLKCTKFYKRCTLYSTIKHKVVSIPFFSPSCFSLTADMMEVVRG